MGCMSRSTELFEASKTLIPGGVNSPVRAFAAVEGDPLFIERGEGHHLIDVDGNRYADLVGSWGPLILGHAHPAVVQAVNDAMSRGASRGDLQGGATHRNLWRPDTIGNRASG